MKHYRISILSFAIITIVFTGYKPNHTPKRHYSDFTDTIPDICSVLSPREIDSLHPLINPLTKTFPDPNNFETYSGCYYQFYKPGEYPQLAVRFIKWGSKEEAAEDFKAQVKSHFDLWGIAPERLYGIADSAFFGYNADDLTICDECGLVAAQGFYGIYISFKGKYENVLREYKMLAALKILQMLYDRIPGLAPSRIRNRQ